MRGLLMSDMSNKRLPIYAKFIEAVKKNDVQRTAELLDEHSFLSDDLEKVMPETKLTPYQFSAQNQDMTELTEVLITFGAMPQKAELISQKITPYQEIPVTQFSPDSSLGSGEIKLAVMPEKSLAERRKDVIKKYHLDIIEKLYILTGMRPFVCNRTLNKDGTQGSHLRFMMPHLKKAQIDMLLKLFNIPFNDGFGSTTHSYISILPTHYNAIDAFLNQPYSSKLSSLSDKKVPSLSVDDLSSDHKIALCDILYSTKFLIGLEKRNNNQYSLDSIMLCLKSFTVKNSPCFEYLEEKRQDPIEKPVPILHFSAHSPVNALPTNPILDKKEPVTTDPSHTKKMVVNLK